MERQLTDVAAIFLEMGELLQIRGGDAHRARAFLRTAHILQKLREPVAEAVKYGTLRGKTGIGDGSLSRIKTILRTGTCPDHQRLLAQVPWSARTLLRVRGLGPRRVQTLYRQLGIKSLDELAAAAQSGRLTSVSGINVQLVLNEVARLRQGEVRFTLPAALAVGDRILRILRDVPGVFRVAQCGSARRRKETVKDVDFLVVTSEAQKATRAFTTMENVAEVMLDGDSRATVRLQSGLQADLRTVPHDNFGAGMHYFTGSKDHNIQLRLRAGQRGLAISEHGVFRASKSAGNDKAMQVAPGTREEEIFAAVGLPFIAPELREADGEFEAAAQRRLPVIVEESDILGEFSLMSDASLGLVPLRTLLAAARARGHRYVAVVEHQRSFSSAKRIYTYLDEVRSLSASSGVEVLAGLTVDIRKGGGFVRSKKLLAACDFVVGRLERGASSDETERVLAAIESGSIDLLARPKGRILLQDAGWPLDMTRILRACSKSGVAVEVSGAPDRLDLNARHCRMAKDLGVKVVLSAEVRSPSSMDNMRYAVMTARRGWLAKTDILNAQPLDAVRAFCRRRRKSVVQVVGADALLASFAAPDDALRLRLTAFLHGGQDPALLQALLRRGGATQNPLQAAMAVLLVD